MKFKLEFSLFDKKEPDKAETTFKSSTDKDGNTSEEFEIKVTRTEDQSRPIGPPIRAAIDKKVDAGKSFFVSMGDAISEICTFIVKGVTGILIFGLGVWLIAVIANGIKDKSARDKELKQKQLERVKFEQAWQKKDAEDKQNEKIRLSEDTYQKAISLQKQAELVGPEQEDAFQLFYKAAELDHAESQYQLGECFLWGLGTTANPNSAFYWLEKAADSNSPGAQWRIGAAYVEGYYYDKDVNKGIELMEKSAGQGFKAAIDFIDERDRQLLSR